MNKGLGSVFLTTAVISTSLSSGTGLWLVSFLFGIQPRLTSIVRLKNQINLKK